MIVPRKNFCVGGTSSTSIRNEIYREATWFRTECLKLIDDVIMMLEYIQESDEGESILRYLYDHHGLDKLPKAPDSWASSPIAPFRLYYHLKRSCEELPAVVYLCSQIIVDEKYINIKDTDEPGNIS